MAKKKIADEFRFSKFYRWMTDHFGVEESPIGGDGGVLLFAFSVVVLGCSIAGVTMLPPGTWQHEVSLWNLIIGTALYLVVWELMYWTCDEKFNDGDNRFLESLTQKTVTFFQTAWLMMLVYMVVGLAVAVFSLGIALFYFAGYAVGWLFQQVLGLPLAAWRGIIIVLLFFGVNALKALVPDKKAKR